MKVSDFTAARRAQDLIDRFSLRGLREIAADEDAILLQQPSHLLQQSRQTGRVIEKAEAAVIHNNIEGRRGQAGREPVSDERATNTGNVSGPHNTHHAFRLIYGSEIDRAWPVHGHDFWRHATEKDTH